MYSIELEEGLRRPTCPKCGAAQIRPVDIDDGRHVRFECPDRKCRWRAHAELPEIRKWFIYLDTSTVSNMAKALHRGESDSQWARLYHALRQSVAAEVVCCPGSWVVKMEAELSTLPDEIVKLSKVFGDPGLKHRLEVVQAQLFRALSRYFAGTTPIQEPTPPSGDAYRHPNDWLPVFSILTRLPSAPGEVAARRTAKGVVREKFEEVYASYDERGDGFREIRDNELAAFGRSIVREGWEVLRRRLGIEPIPAGDDPTHYLPIFPTTFDILALSITRQRGVSSMEAAKEVERFLLSDHVKMLPLANINALLHAGVAMACRGKWPRKPKPGDAYDIEHISTYAPYVDIFIADAFFANLCNSQELRIGDCYGTEIISLGKNEVESFIARLEEMTATASHAPLAGRIRQAIREGGFHEEFDELARAYLKKRGVEVSEDPTRR